MTNTGSYLLLIPLAPALGAVAAGILAITRKAQRAAPLLTAAATLVAGLIALSTRGAGGHITVPWFDVGTLHAELGVHIDGLTLTMVCTVCLVSFLVQVYSIGYMAGDGGYARYFTYLSLFTASMLGLVVANNLLQLYGCWELVGICSYLLIGFWWRKPSAATAAKKAFIMTRFGDLGFLLGVVLLTSVAGSFAFSDIFRSVEQIAAGTLRTVPLVSPHTFLWLAPVLLFCGAVGKSAQFPLHVWLPDAMEGPTPVSALIHAATMVAAGVYMVGRLLPVFEAAPAALDVVLLTGAITALIAATIAIVQTDIKKVMAYSTISQLGYMMMAMGAGADEGRPAGFFHLTTHAVFKALLFLTAGSVIHAMHHSDNPNDLRGMGGLRRRMPITSITCLIGVLALTGFPLLSGFFSKDAVLASLLAHASTRPTAGIALAIGMLVAGITAFYGMRMWMMAFHGNPRSETAAHAQEGPLTMTLPLVILAAPSVFLGGWLHQTGYFQALFAEGTPRPETVNLALAGAAMVVAAIGYLLAWRLYSTPDLASDPVERMPAGLYRVFANGWGMDTFWTKIVAGGALSFGRSVAWFDRRVIDHAVDMVGGICAAAGDFTRRSSDGQAQTYAAVMLAALLALIALRGGSGHPARYGAAPAAPAVRAAASAAPPPLWVAAPVRAAADASQASNGSAR